MMQDAPQGRAAAPVEPPHGRSLPATADQALHRRWPLAGLTALAVLGMAAWLLAGRGALVKTTVVKRGSAAEVVYATGIVEPLHWAKVASLQRKRIVWMCTGCEGRPVKKGEVLARLDDVEERALLTELEARLGRIKEDAARLETLVQRNVTARTTVDEKLTQVREFEARVAAQRDRIADLELRAPMDGVVLRRDGEVGEIAGTANADVLFWIGEPKPLRIVAEVNEDDILKVRDGQNALLRHDGQGSTALTASVASVTPKGDPQSKTFRVFLDLPDDTPLRIGMSVEANIVARDVKDALIVPAEAVLDGKVMLADNGRVVRRPVETGIRGSGGIEIKTGLVSGQTIISPFMPTLKDGARVRAEAGTPR